MRGKLHERFLGFKSTTEALNYLANKVQTGILIDRNQNINTIKMKLDQARALLECSHRKSLNNTAQETMALENDSCALCSWYHQFMTKDLIPNRCPSMMLGLIWTHEHTNSIPWCKPLVTDPS